ncbi:amino acid adenylation domain-containing protein [Allokutzneria sp. A3M-2-11 16]|uniref:Pls/PosA family non-ribosomal peptide synthetase n=1 Tax=Allokutzneria sp. A3M-2-11 16 TaxID=2962043 RepID=UPI0020B89D57|nr:Pls/PosA family non-ribosomal peptide synthetase [Allokutzneria sp. A3M-2-11 16]MCP3798358.1 amino acid adenylation domain-containing protein [Allokutzneria sp. A3M-2-11 16]
MDSKYQLLENDQEACLHEVFEAQADKSPDALAVVCGDRRLTYLELDERANQLAHRLRAGGIGHGEFVAIYFERSELPIVAILACHKAGVAYVPVDPGYPADRIAHIVAELGVAACLSERALADAAEAYFAGVPVLLADEVGDVSPVSRLSEQEERVSPSALAYVIYTSGTTGRPKGVLTEHRHVTRFVAAFNEVCATGPDDRVFQGFSLSFDGSVEEIWMAFSNQSTLVVPTADAPRLGQELGNYLAELGITYFSTVPTLLATLPEDVPSLRTIVLSGEVCRPELVARWERRGLRILNVYGPTEATVNTTAIECRSDRPVTIGTPLRGYRIHLLDEDLRPVPEGAVGELFVSGATLARGYHNQPELTAQRFLSATELEFGVPGERYYRTGDLARWNDGELEFLGRADGQVKIRGYRVELAEIEAVLTEHAQITSACVRLTERDGLQVLAAYVVSGDIDRGEVLALLEAKLPAYMVPGYLDRLPELPRTTSGKVDRGRLPDPIAPLVRTATEIVAPETDLECEIAAVFSAAVGVAEPSAVADFFSELGGHSLTAAKAATALREKTDHPVTLRMIYQYPTIRQLAVHLESTRPAPAPSATTASSAQVFAAVPRWQRAVTYVVQGISQYALFAPASITTALITLAGWSWYGGGMSTSALIGLSALLSVTVWPALLLLSVVAKWVLVGRFREGSHPLWGWYFCRWWLANAFMAMSGAGALAGTPLLPLYYRLMGARVGARCTLDTAQCSAWDLVSIGADTSVGADTQLLGYRVENGMVHFGRVSIGSRCYVGMRSALGLNVAMGDDSALADQTLLPDGDVLPAGQAVLGSPPQPVELDLPEPAARQSAFRRAVFGLAHLVAQSLVLLLVVTVPSVGVLSAWWALFAEQGLTVGLLGAAALIPVSVVPYCVYLALLKRLASWRIRPGDYSVLSVSYLRKWFADNVMDASKVLLQPVYTTLYLPPLLRLMGAKIGRRAEISKVWRFSPELVEIGEESFFADGSIIGGRQCHRGTMRLAANRIGRRSFVGNIAILPVGTSLGDNCLLGVQSITPNSCREVADGTEWLGSPSFRLPHRVKVGNFDPTVTFQPTRRLYAERAVIDGLRVLIPYFLAFGMLLAASSSLLLVNSAYGATAALLSAPVIGIATALLGSLAVAGLKKLVMGTFRPEIKPLWSRYVWLNEMVNGAFISVSTPALTPLLGTPWIAPMLRTLGCRIGRRTYLATLLFSEFDLVNIGNYAALNRGSLVQNHLFEDRVFKSSAQTIGDGATLGNMSVALYDSEVGSDVTVGPLSLVMKGETLLGPSKWHGIPTTPIHH